MNVLIFGASGFIGKALVNHLLTKDYQITIVTRNKQNAKKMFPSDINIIEWQDQNIPLLSSILNSTDAIVNLAGENIASKLWTKKHKAKILDSRIRIGARIMETIENSTNKPKILIQASAIGFYGYNIENKCFDDGISGNGFLSEVCRKWEKSTEAALNYRIKTAIIRTGLVLGKNGGIFPKLMKSIKLFAGTNLGKGENWVSWIHLEDEIRAIEFILRNNLNGVFNLTSPNPLPSKKINKSIAKKLNRPIMLNIPKFILNLFLGDMAKELFLANQIIIPKNLLDAGFKFNYPTIEEALIELTS